MTIQMEFPTFSSFCKEKMETNHFIAESQILFLSSVEIPGLKNK